MSVAIGDRAPFVSGYIHWYGCFHVSMAASAFVRTDMSFFFFVGALRVRVPADFATTADFCSSGEGQSQTQRPGTVRAFEFSIYLYCIYILPTDLAVAAEASPELSNRTQFERLWRS